MNTVADNSPNSKLASAVDLVNRGWFVHILRPGMKVPATPNGQKDATQDLATIFDWWGQLPEGNPAVACEPSGLYVIDVDMGMGKVGAESWASLVALHGHVETFTVRTRSGGLHYYYALPEALPGASETTSSPSDQPRMRNSASKLGKDIDTRGNGYVVAPGSVVDGGAYVIELDIPPAPLPEWVRSALAPSQAAHADVEQPHAPATSHFVPASDDEVKARIAVLAEELRTAENGQRNDTASRIAYMAGQYVGAGQLNHDYICAELLKAVKGWPNQAKTIGTITRQAAEGATNPRAWSATPPPKSGQAQSQSDADAIANAIADHDADDYAGQMSDWSTDHGQAAFLRDRVGGILYVEGLGWHVWDGVRWHSVAERYILQAATEFYKKQFQMAAEKYSTTTQEKWMIIAQCYRKFMGTNRLGSIVKALQSTAGVYVPDPAKLDSYPELLNTPDGILSLRTGEVRPHDPKYLLTKVTRGSYRPGTTHADWDQALKAMPAENREFAQLRFGQALTGYIPESDDLLLLNGKGSNGKSLWTASGVLSAVGDYGMLSRETLIVASDGGGNATPERARLRGARFVLIEELPEGRSLNVSEIKRIIGVDSISARQLYMNDFTFEPTHTLFVTSNYMPIISETDDGTWRRMMTFDFPYTFKPTPGPGQLYGDSGIKLRVKQGRDGQHDAIVTWLVEGAMRYLNAKDQQKVLTDAPEAFRAKLDDWRRSMDHIFGYFEDYIVADPEGSISTSDLHWDFTRYLEENGNRAWSLSLLMSRLKNHAVMESNRAEVSRTWDTSGISRPALPKNAQWISSQPPLSQRPKVIRGFRFRDEARPSEGPVNPNPNQSQNTVIIDLTQQRGTGR